MPEMRDRLHDQHVGAYWLFVPEGHAKIAHRFQRWGTARRKTERVPQGTIEIVGRASQRNELRLLAFIGSVPPQKQPLGALQFGCQSLNGSSTLVYNVRAELKNNLAPTPALGFGFRCGISGLTALVWDLARHFAHNITLPLGYHRLRFQYPTRFDSADSPAGSETVSSEQRADNER